MLFVVAAIWPSTALASTGSEKVAWYLRGEADIVFGARGWTVGSLTCKTAGQKFRCNIRIDSKAGHSLCSHGLFRLDRFSVSGLFSAPKPCLPS